MSTAPMAQAISDMQTAVIDLLANATATFADTSVAACIFDAAYALALVGREGMGATAPVCTVATAAVPAAVLAALADGTDLQDAALVLTIGSASYLIADCQHDGTGLSQLLLQSTP